MSLLRWGKTAQKVRIPAGTVLGVAFLLLMHPSIRSLWIGCTVAFSGSLLRIWAAGHIDKGKALTQGGPYARTRNPIYLGSLWMATGVLLAGQGYWLLLPFALFYATLYYPVMKAEEQELLEQYGERFERYASAVPLFLPRLSTITGTPSTFLWARVVKNGEHRTVAGLLLIETFLILKIVY